MPELNPPRKPEPHECCGTGCIPCVMDIYEEELYEYEKALKRAGDAVLPQPPAAPAVVGSGD
jgi:hypothetical protein